MNICAGENTTIDYGGVIAQIISISGPNESRPTIPTTTLDSTAQEFRFGLTDGGEVTVDFYYDASSHSSLHGYLNDSTSQAATLTLKEADDSTNDVITFDAFLVGWDLSGMESESNVTASMTLKIDGAVNY